MLKEVIQEVGVDNVVQAITDNAKNCSAAGALVHQMCPHIFWTPCVVHTLNLAQSCLTKCLHGKECREQCDYFRRVFLDNGSSQ